MFLDPPLINIHLLITFSCKYYGIFFLEAFAFSPKKHDDDIVIKNVMCQKFIVTFYHHHFVKKLWKLYFANSQQIVHPTLLSHCDQNVMKLWCLKICTHFLDYSIWKLPPSKKLADHQRWLGVLRLNQLSQILYD